MTERANGYNHKQRTGIDGGNNNPSEIDMNSTNAGLHQFIAEWDAEGVYLYQAFNSEIADWALEHQTFAGCPAFNPLRMTWVKPSFAWVLYRSGYGRKKNQGRILKIKVGHDVLGRMLSQCACGHGHGRTTQGRVQWDPERDIMMSDNGREPRRMLRRRAIQIGVSKDLSRDYVAHILRIEDVTALATRVREAHQVLWRHPKSDAMQEVVPLLPLERPYMPHVSHDVLVRLCLARDEAAANRMESSESG